MNFTRKAKAMASSSIEVLGVASGEVKVMLMDDSVGDDGEMDEELQTIITAQADDNGGMIASVEQAQMDPGDEDFGMDGDFTTLDSMEPPPGTIIFSPQDLLRPSKPTSRGRGRGTGLLRGFGASIKQEQSMAPPTYGPSGDLEVPVACEVCGKVMMTGKTLVQHMAIHSDLKPFQCPHCPKSFARKVHLQGHLVVHGIEKQFECPVCHQRFSRQDCVKVHMRLHDKSKCVYCDVCHKAFLTVGALNIHLRIHRGEKPFKCHLCSKCFTQKNHLITHIKRHTKVTDEHFTKKLGPRMFKCEHCPRSFIRLSDYERHVQWNHGAVAEGSIVDKLPTVASLIEGELRQTGLTPQVFKAPKDAMNSRPRVRRPKKVMCTTSTQTDDDGGRVIIPRKYQVSASTQVSAPPTPRREEEMYESDMFDEGMDRNYSSEEEEEEGGEGVGGREDPLEQKVFSLPATSEMASDPIQDAAFDAVVQGRPAKEQQQQQDEHSEFLQEVVNSMARQQQQQQQQQQAAPPSPPHSQAVGDDSCEMPEIRSVVPTVGRIIIPYKPAVTEHHEPVMKEVLVNPVKVKKEPVGVLPIKLHNPPKRGRGRGRGRGRKWNPYGLTGAAELRAIRMSMMKNIMNNEVAEEEAKLCAKQEGGQVEQAVVVEEVVEGRGKRQAKNKQHGKDFVCTMKNCETCYPQTKARPVAAPQTKTVPLRKAARVVTGSRADSVHGLLSLAGAPPLLRNVKIEQNAPRPEEMKMKVGNRVGSYPVDITANPIPVMRSSGSGSHREDFFVTSSSGESIMSPPVELTSFCIPTYSCKLCSREFRFEGKLHRHIESVHQNKAIFSPDVKPGRGSSRMMPPPGTLIPTHITPTHTTTTAKLGETENPEIAALRSEWDDDEDDPEEVEASQGSVQVSHGSGISMAIVTRDITRSTTTVTDAYSGGVKVNMNKLAGLLPQMAKAIPLGRQGVGMAQEEKDEKVSQSQRAVTREPETITADTLDMKCRRLLEKLFGQELLLQCGLLEEHVSVVLGKVLQHYGVKMIEDYGQGQYEVLKYNLWRLIEWKVTMEQMEEFYTEGKSVEEMMDDIMHDHVPLVSHHYVPPSQSSAPQPTTVTTVPTTTTHVQMQSHSGTLEAVEVSEGQVMLQHVAGMLGSHGISLPDGVTQVVLSQDVTPELLQGAHIVTIDPATGQVLSQVTADQVILADALTDELEQQVSALDGGGQMVVQGAGGQTLVVQTQHSSLSSLPLHHQHQGQILVEASPHTTTTTHHQGVKMEGVTTTTTTTTIPHHNH